MFKVNNSDKKLLKNFMAPFYGWGSTPFKFFS